MENIWGYKLGIREIVPGFFNQTWRGKGQRVRRKITEGSEEGINGRRKGEEGEEIWSPYFPSERT